MSTAPYTLRSFVELAERENHRGRDISRIDVTVARATRALRERREKYREAMAALSRDDSARAAVRDRFRDDRKLLRLARDQAVEVALYNALVQFESKLTLEEFTFSLKPGPRVGGKATYQIGSALDISFPAKQAADALKRAAQIEAPSRNSIVRALKASLGRRYLHAIYKLDIESFFESIPHATLLEQVSKYSSLDSVSVQLVRTLLAEFEGAHGRSVGLPRGVGLSSHLAELYLSNFDAVVRTHPGVLFYARYVDDIVVVLEGESALIEVRAAVARELSALHLTPNQKKTHAMITADNGDYQPGDAIEYLGYRFSRTGKTLATGLTDKRKSRRVRRLRLALECWLDTAPNAVWPNHGHNGMLLDRVRYLAGNTRLLHSKSNVAIGLYFSNSALDADARELADLDEILNEFRLQHSLKMPEQLKIRLSEVSFTRMFVEKQFLRFRQKRIEQIVSIWNGVG